MARHECQIPGGVTGQKKWKCPTCHRTWQWNPAAGAGADLWHGRDDIRKADGSKPRGGLWAWLTR